MNIYQPQCDWQQPAFLQEEQVRFAVNVVRVAARIARRVSLNMIDVSHAKKDRSPVTVADYAIQSYIAKKLYDFSPEVDLIGEEGSAHLQDPQNQSILARVTEFVCEELSMATSEEVCAWIDRGNLSSNPDRFWTLDPIDGTKGFLRRAHYATALAFVERGSVQLGVLGCPQLVFYSAQGTEMTGALILARKGEGCWLGSLEEDDNQLSPLRVSSTKDARRARILRSFEAAHTDKDGITSVAEALGTTADPALMDSQAKYSILAQGEGDVLFRLLSPKQPDYREKIWDQAAGALVVQEAGGTITDLDGQPLDFTRGRTLAHNRGIIASNGWLHDCAVDAIRRLHL